MIIAPHITSEFAYFNALFIQPTPWCARNCNGCYVKGFEEVQGVTESEDTLIGDLISEIGGRIRVNQVTLAIDKKPNDKIRSYAMDTIVSNFLERIGYSEEQGHKIEFHATVHTLNDLLEYPHFWDSPHQKLDMLSISHLNVQDYIPELRTYVAPHINWNLTVDPTINMDKIKSTFQKIASTVDSVYLVLHKPNLGHFFDEQAFVVHQDFIRFIRTMPEEIRNKVHIDGCIQDSKHFLDTGYGCSSNVSRFQVWPNGSVTGCAYNQNRVTGPATNLDELFKNFVTAKKTYEFDKCKIPNHIDPKHPRVYARQNYLEIID